MVNGVAGNWYASRITIDPNALYSSLIEWYRDGVLVRTMRMWPGGNIYDPILHDSVVVYKDAAGDTVSIGGQK
jgi:hypothetical protein